MFDGLIATPLRVRAVPTTAAGSVFVNLLERSPCIMTLLLQTRVVFILGVELSTHYK